MCLAIGDTDQSRLTKDPQATFSDIALQVTNKLEKKGIGIFDPYPYTLDAFQTACDTALKLLAENAVVNASEPCAAQRILDTFTRWMVNHPGAAYFVRTTAAGRFELVMNSTTKERTFRGDTIQDAYAQAAQVLQLEGI